MAITMEELKRKAQAYDKVREKIALRFGSNVAEEIFSEFEMNEDERVRKELIELIGCMHDADPRKKGWIDWLEKQGEPIDEIEPKFHEGDWIISNNKKYIYQVVKVKRGIYVVRDNADDREYHVSIESADRDGRLWNISDAKEGDVLVNGSNIFIFHFIDNTRLMGYYHVNTDDGRFYDDIGKNECFCLIDAVVNPATKEQRDILIKAMTDAGYMFDFEKKELKKLGQQCEVPVTINIDKMVMDYTNECGNDGFGKPLNCMIRAYRQGLTDAICTLTLANKKTTDKVEQEPTKWTEEDECYMSECIGAIATKDGWSFEEKRKTKKWLKSLKQRIGG